MMSASAALAMVSQAFVRSYTVTFPSSSSAFQDKSPGFDVNPSSITIFINALSFLQKYEKNRNFATMMTILYIIIGVAVGAVAVYLLMNRKVTGLHVELVRKDTELTMLAQQHSEEVKMREQQFNEQLKTTKEQLHVMAQQLMDAQAKRLKEENTESMGHITQPLKDAISEMRKAINDNTKDHTAQTASLREQLRLMMESNREIGEKAESLTNVLRRDNKVSGNMGEIILGDLLTSQGLTEGIHYEVQARLRDNQGRPLKNDYTGKEMQPDVILHYPQ
jgi:DNA recombination protein RmuC